MELVLFVAGYAFTRNSRYMPLPPCIPSSPDTPPPPMSLQVPPGAPLHINLTAISYIGAQVIGARVTLTWRVTGSGDDGSISGSGSGMEAMPASMSVSSSTSPSEPGSSSAEGVVEVVTGPGGVGSVVIPLDTLTGSNATRVRCGVMAAFFHMPLGESCMHKGGAGYEQVSMLYDEASTSTQPAGPTKGFPVILAESSSCPG